MWGRMAAAAVTRGTPGGKSQGLSPASPPPRQGAQLHPPGRGSPRRGPPPLLRVRPHCPLPSSSPAPGGAARRRAPRLTCRAETVWGTPALPLPLARRMPADSAPQLLQNIPPCRREAGPSHLRASPGTTAPPWGAVPGHLRTLAGGLARNAHLRPGAESLPQPRLYNAQLSSDRPPPPLHPRTPGGARTESLRELPSVPPGGSGLRLDPE